MKNGVTCIIIFLFFGLAFTSTVRTSRLELLSYPKLFRNYDGNTLYVGGSGSENYIAGIRRSSSNLRPVFFSHSSTGIEYFSWILSP